MTDFSLAIKYWTNCMYIYLFLDQTAVGSLRRLIHWEAFLWPKYLFLASIYFNSVFKFFPSALRCVPMKITPT